MVPALRDYHLVVLDLLVENDVTADRILRVKTLRDILLPCLAHRVRRFVEMHSRSAVAKRDDVEIQRSRPSQRASAAIERGAGRKDIIDENVMQRRINGRAGCECKGIFQIRHSSATVKRG